MQKRKIFDIIPPEKFDIIPPEKTEKAEEITKKGPLFIVEKEDLAVSSPLFSKKALIFASFFILVIAFALSYIFIEPRLKIEISPLIESPVFKTKLIVGSGLNFSTSSIPAEILETESFVSEEFPSSGVFFKEEKARGKIRVYNAYSVSSQPLLVNTRFVSAEGKLFRSPNRVVVPGASYEGEKLAPGFVDIEVVADEPGPEYNIGPSTFSLPGFVGTPKYTAFYGKSTSSMAGGMRTEIRRVTQEDLDNGKRKAAGKALEESRAQLKNKLPPDSLMLDETIYTWTIEALPLAKVDQELTSFVFQARAGAKNLIFKKSALNDFAKNYVSNQLYPQEAVLEESLNIKYFPDIDNLGLNKITLNLEISIKIYQKPNEELIKEETKGKNFFELQQAVSKIYPASSDIKINFWPFWVRKAPQDVDKIEVKVITGG